MASASRAWSIDQRIVVESSPGCESLVSGPGRLAPKATGDPRFFCKDLEGGRTAVQCERSRPRPAPGNVWAKRLLQATD